MEKTQKTVFDELTRGLKLREYVLLFTLKALSLLSHKKR